MKPQPSVFVPPGAGQRSGVKASPLAPPAPKRARSIAAGWLFVQISAFIAILFGLGMGFFTVEDSQKGARVMSAPPATFPNLSMGVAGHVGYLLFGLYVVVWWVVPIIGIAQGDGLGAVVFFLASPFVLALSGIFGWYLGSVIVSVVT